MKRRCSALASALAVAALILPQWEEAVCREVCRDKGLTERQGRLLRAIRRAENGRPEKAFGVMDARCRTFRKQAEWCANTIKRRFTGDIDAFAQRWTPEDNPAQWARNVRFFLRKQEEAAR